MSTSKYVASGNRLLTSLPARVHRRFMAGCKQVRVEADEVLCEAGNEISHVYFPTNSFVSLVTRLDDGARLEVVMVGDEGMLGIPLILGVNQSVQQIVVQGAGSAWRMPAAQFTSLCLDSVALRLSFTRYIYVLMRQMALSATCTHYHVVEERVARWLLLTRDRAHSDKFHLTHELMAVMLGVRRVGITEAAMSLHTRGFITYSRGDITILNVTGLEGASCRCYRDAQHIYDQTLGKAGQSRSDKDRRQLRS